MELNVLDQNYRRIDKGEWNLEDYTPVVEKQNTLVEQKKYWETNSCRGYLEDMGASAYSPQYMIDLVADVEESFRQWIGQVDIQSSIFAKVKKNGKEQILVIINTPDIELHKFPWMSWELFAIFPHAGISFCDHSPVDYENIVSCRSGLLSLLNKPINEIKIKVESSYFSIGNQRVKLTLVQASNTNLRTREEEANLRDIYPDLRTLNLSDIIQQQINRAELELIIIAGHGDRSGVMDHDGRMVGIEEIALMFQQSRQQVSELVFFNTCESIDIGRHLVKKSIVAQAIVTTERIPDVVALMVSTYLARDYGNLPSWLILRKIWEEMKRRERDPFTKQRTSYIGTNSPILYVNWEHLQKAQKDTIDIKISMEAIIKSMVVMACITSVSLFIGISSNPSGKKIISQMAGTPIKVIDTATNFYQIYFQSYKTYTDEDYKIQISYPDNWKRQEELDGVLGDAISWLPPNNRDVKITLNIRELTGNPMDLSGKFIGLKEFQEILIEELIKPKSNFKGELSTLANRPGRTINFSANEESKRYRRTTIFTLKDNKAYIITYSAPEEVFAKYESTAKKIIDSLKILD